MQNFTIYSNEQGKCLAEVNKRKSTDKKTVTLTADNTKDCTSITFSYKDSSFDKNNNTKFILDESFTIPLELTSGSNLYVDSSKSSAPISINSIDSSFFNIGSNDIKLNGSSDNGIKADSNASIFVGPHCKRNHIKDGVMKDKTQDGIVVGINPSNTNNNSIVKEIKEISSDDNSGKKYRIAVLDMFDEQDIDLNGDGIKDVSHGSVVQSIIKSEFENRGAKVEIIPIKLEKPKINKKATPEENFKRIQEQSQTIRNQFQLLSNLDKEKHFDGVNMSLSPSFEYQNQNPITEEEKQEFSREMENLMPNEYDKLKQLEKMAANGTVVSVSGGNDAYDNINVLATGKGIYGVGATDRDNNKLHYSSIHANAIAQGRFEIREIIDPKTNKRYYDVNEDGIPDFTEEDLKKPKMVKGKPFFNSKTIEGTSFSSPMFLVEKLTGKRERILN